MNKELKPCPFCGAEIKDTHHRLNESWGIYHSCDKKNLTVFITVYGDSEKDLIDNWNRRVGYVD